MSVERTNLPSVSVLSPERFATLDGGRGLGVDSAACKECGELVEPGDYVYVHHFAQVGDDGALASKGGVVRRAFHNDCWQEQYGAEPCLHWETRSVEQVRAVLEASDGELVLDSRPRTVGGRGYVRIVDGQLDMVTIKRERVSDGAGPGADEPTIRFSPERVHNLDYDPIEHIVQWQGDGPLPPVQIKPVDETPFADLDPLDED